MPERIAPRPINAELKSELDGRLAKIVNKRVLSPGFATRAMDGRLVPFVFVVVQDNQRQPLSGVLLELRDAAGDVIDTTRTSATGAGVLRFPARRPRPPRKSIEGARVTV